MDTPDLRSQAGYTGKASDAPPRAVAAVVGLALALSACSGEDSGSEAAASSGAPPSTDAAVRAEPAPEGPFGASCSAVPTQGDGSLAAMAGAPVVAAAPGRVVWAGYRAGGWGLLVTIAHRDGVRTMYAHLSRVGVRLGERVGVGTRVGRVGATGDATGPHLHFEVRLRGAAVDPLPALR
jgi:murein DD-endopeptidase MepM/ murein hydrolase activator NlpD